MRIPLSDLELPGWELCWMPLAVTGDGGTELGLRRRRVAAELASRWTPATLGEDPVVAAMRRQADPSRSAVKPLMPRSTPHRPSHANHCIDGRSREAPPG